MDNPRLLSWKLRALINILCPRSLIGAKKKVKEVTVPQRNSQDLRRNWKLPLPTSVFTLQLNVSLKCVYQWVSEVLEMDFITIEPGQLFSPASSPYAMLS